MKFDFDDGAFETWVPERETWKYKKTLSSPEFYKSRAWLSMRKRVLKFYGRKCMKCATIHGAIQIDHIKPRSIYPQLSLDFNNLQVLCRDCNFDKGTQTKDYRK